MSRYYRVTVKAKNITEEQLDKVMTDELGWESSGSSWVEGKEGDIVGYEGEGYLCGGMSEEEAHEQIEKLLKKVNKKAKVLTGWTYLEDLPKDEYGSLD